MTHPASQCLNGTGATPTAGTARAPTHDLRVINLFEDRLNADCRTLPRSTAD